MASPQARLTALPASPLIWAAAVAAVAVAAAVRAAAWPALLCMVVSTGAGVLWEQRRRAASLDMRLIPGPWRQGLPVVGNLPDLLRLDYHRVLLDWANTYGGIYRMRVLWFDVLVVSDPTCVATICGRGPGALDKSRILYTPVSQGTTQLGHPNMVTASTFEPEWRAVRKAVSPAFSFQNIRKQYPVISGCTKRLVTQLAELSEGAAASGQGPLTVDVDQAALRVTLDVIGLVAFGHDYRSVYQGGNCMTPAPDHHLLRVLPRGMNEVMNRLTNPLRAVVPRLFKHGPKGEQAFEAFRREMRVLLRRCLLRETPPLADDMSVTAHLWRAYHEQQPPPPPATQLPGPHSDAPGSAWEERMGGLLAPCPSPLNLLRHRLTELKLSLTYHTRAAEAGPDRAGLPAHKRSALLSADRILGEIGVLVVAGYETTGHTVSWTLLNVATVPGVQDKIAAELDSLGLLCHPPSGSPSCSSSRNTSAAKHPGQLARSASGHCECSGSPGITAGVPDAVRAAHQHGRHATTCSGMPEEKPAQNHAAVCNDASLPGKEPIRDSWPLPRCVELDDLPRLKYLTAVIKESMRMQPAISVIGKGVGAKATRIGPYLVPPGTPVAIPMYVIQNAVSNWERPQEFLAERWLQVPIESYLVARMPPLHPPHTPADAADPNSTPRGSLASSKPDATDTDHSANPGSATGGPAEIRFMPFSEGPRNCVGQTLARIEVVSMLACLLGAFRVELAPEMGDRQEVLKREASRLTLQLRGSQGLRMVLHPRWL